MKEEKAKGRYPIWSSGGQKFCLPTTLTVCSHTNKRGKVVAHALDFDLVAAAETQEAAIEKLRISVKAYVEHGIMNNLRGMIPCPAPDEYWPAPVESLNVRFLPPIHIEDTRINVLDARIAPLNNNDETPELADVAH